MRAIIAFVCFVVCGTLGVVAFDNIPNQGAAMTFKAGFMAALSLLTALAMLPAKTSPLQQEKDHDQR